MKLPHLNKKLIIKIVAFFAIIGLGFGIYILLKKSNLGKTCDRSTYKCTVDGPWKDKCMPSNYCSDSGYINGPNCDCTINCDEGSPFTNEGESSTPMSLDPVTNKYSPVNKLHCGKACIYSDSAGPSGKGGKGWCESEDLCGEFIPPPVPPGGTVPDHQHGCFDQAHWRGCGVGGTTVPDGQLICPKPLAGPPLPCDKDFTSCPFQKCTSVSNHVIACDITQADPTAGCDSGAKCMPILDAISPPSTPTPNPAPHSKQFQRVGYCGNSTTGKPKSNLSLDEPRCKDYSLISETQQTGGDWSTDSFNNVLATCDSANNNLVGVSQLIEQCENAVENRCAINGVCGNGWQAQPTDKTDCSSGNPTQITPGDDPSYLPTINCCEYPVDKRTGNPFCCVTDTKDCLNLTNAPYSLNRLDSTKYTISDVANCTIGGTECQSYNPLLYKALGIAPSPSPPSDVYMYCAAPSPSPGTPGYCQAACGHIETSGGPPGKYGTETIKSPKGPTVRVGWCSQKSDGCTLGPTIKYRGGKTIDEVPLCFDPSGPPSPPSPPSPSKAYWGGSGGLGDGKSTTATRQLIEDTKGGHECSKSGADLCASDLDNMSGVYSVSPNNEFTQCEYKIECDHDFIVQPKGSPTSIPWNSMANASSLNILYPNDVSADGIEKIAQTPKDPDIFPYSIPVPSPSPSPVCQGTIPKDDSIAHTVFNKWLTEAPSNVWVDSGGPVGSCSFSSSGGGTQINKLSTGEYCPDGVNQKGDECCIPSTTRHDDQCIT